MCLCYILMCSVSELIDKSIVEIETDASEVRRSAGF